MWCQIRRIDIIDVPWLIRSTRGNIWLVESEERNAVLSKGWAQYFCLKFQQFICTINGPIKNVVSLTDWKTNSLELSCFSQPNKLFVLNLCQQQKIWSQPHAQQEKLLVSFKQWSVLLLWLYSVYLIRDGLEIRTIYLARRI